LKISRLFRQDQDQDQDFYFKTKTKTIFHVLEVPRDQDQGLKTTSLVTVWHSGSARQPNFVALTRWCHPIFGRATITFGIGAHV